MSSFGSIAFPYSGEKFLFILIPRMLPYFDTIITHPVFHIKRPLCSLRHLHDCCQIEKYAWKKSSEDQECNCHHTEKNRVLLKIVSHSRQDTRDDCLFFIPFQSFLF